MMAPPSQFLPMATSAAQRGGGGPGHDIGKRSFPHLNYLKVAGLYVLAKATRNDLRSNFLGWSQTPRGSCVHQKLPSGCKARCTALLVRTMMVMVTMIVRNFLQARRLQSFQEKGEVAVCLNV